MGLFSYYPVGGLDREIGYTWKTIAGPGVKRPKYIKSGQIQKSNRKFATPWKNQKSSR